jgi:hypothetical protein
MTGDSLYCCCYRALTVKVVAVVQVVEGKVGAVVGTVVIEVVGPAVMVVVVVVVAEVINDVRAAGAVTGFFYSAACVFRGGLPLLLLLLLG